MDETMIEIFINPTNDGSDYLFNLNIPNMVEIFNLPPGSPIIITCFLEDKLLPVRPYISEEIKDGSFIKSLIDYILKEISKDTKDTKSTPSSDVGGIER